MPPDWPNRHLSRLVTVAPHRWHLQSDGAGPLLLLLHGAGASSHSWRHLIAPLVAAGYAVLVPDLPGQGFTRLGDRMRAGLDPMAADLARLLAHLDARPAAIIGHSAGAAIALRLAEILPDPPAAVVGINAALGPFEGVAGWLFPVVARLLALNPLIPRLFARLSGTEARVRSLLASTGSPLDPAGIALYRRLVADPAHVDATLAMMAQWSLDPLLARLPAFAVPTLLLTAAGDRAVPPATSARAVARMPAATWTDIPRFGHLVHEEDPAAVLAHVLPFLARHPPAAADPARNRLAPLPPRD
jgi:magnesium chelatase accessory protein